MISSPAELAAIAATLRASGSVFAEEEARLLAGAARTPAELADLVRRRAAGLPIEHILGWAEFCGLRIPVASGVFIPRRRTEFLVAQAVRELRDLPGGHGDIRERPECRCGHGAADGANPPLVVDLCCGSGAIGAAIAAALDGRVGLRAADADPAAIRCARRTIRPYGGRAYLGDLYQALPESVRGRIDALAANVPYVPSAEIRLLPAEARLHEPRAALDGGADGLDVLRAVVAGAPRWLARGGFVLSEISPRQEMAAVAAVHRAGLTPSVARSTEADVSVIIGRKG